MFARLPLVGRICADPNGLVGYISNIRDNSISVTYPNHGPAKTEWLLGELDLTTGFYIF